MPELSLVVDHILGAQLTVSSLFLLLEVTCSDCTAPKKLLILLTLPLMIAFSHKFCLIFSIHQTDSLVFTRTDRRRCLARDSLVILAPIFSAFFELILFLT